MKDDPNGVTIGDVAELYEQHPYPPVDQDIEAYARGEAWLLESPNPSFHLYWPYRDRTDDLDILIAGCGTQQAAQVAAGLPGARIVGTDISKKSLATTRKLADRINVTNLELIECPLEETQSLGRDFDLIISTGVLHHLIDPAAGLQALAAALRPGGSMHLMLYGGHGRTGVYMLQDLFRTLGVDPAKARANDIRAVREAVEALPETHPFHAVQALHPDWQDDDGLVDLLLHVRDRPFSMLEVEDFLSGAGMKMQKLLFAGRTDPAFTPLSGGRLGRQLAKLPDIEQRAAVELFRAAVKKHVFVACHRDRPAESYEIDLSPAHWPELVPIMAYGLEVEQPKDGRDTYVIRWPYHGMPGIEVEASENAMKIMEGIDGARTLADIGGGAGLDPSNKALTKHLAAFVEMAARADFLSFTSTRRGAASTSSD